MDRLSPAPLSPESGTPSELSTYCAGMPQLSLAGLSENWLLKECGHLHWQAIARAHGLAAPAFRDGAGHQAYAAFTAVRISNASLDAVAEHDMFSIAVRNTPAGRTQHFSTQEVSAWGRQVARVDMLSVFVRREQWGSNHSVMKTPVSGRSDKGMDPVLVSQAEDMQNWSRAFRSGEWDKGGKGNEGDKGNEGGGRLGFSAAQRGKLAQFRITPCPSSDFNGAGFLYFANFQNIVDRAEWAWFGASGAVLPVTREMAFYGNIDPGDSIDVRLCAHREGPAEIAHWCTLHRGSDGARIADVLTSKRRMPAWPIPEARQRK